MYEMRGDEKERRQRLDARSKYVIGQMEINRDPDE